LFGRYKYKWELQMGLFDSIASQAGGVFSNLGGESHPGILEIVTGLIGRSDSGGLSGLVEVFQQNGLGEAVASWVGTGQNLPISAEQLQSVLGNEQVRSIAQKLGLSSEDAASALAKVLPHAIDHLTPDGQVPEGSLLQQGLALLTRFGSKA
jgi:uncharacterized protein YidB (DUF937 family)